MKINLYSLPTTNANGLKVNKSSAAVKNDKGALDTNINEGGAVLYDRLPFKSGISNNLMKLGLSLRNNSGGNSEGVLLDEFSTKYKEIKENGISGNQDNDNYFDQFFQNSVLDSVGGFDAKAANAMCQNDLKEMALRSEMVMLLVRGLGITSGRVDMSDRGIAKMIELYREKLKNGTLSSPYAEIRDTGVFNEYCEKYYKEKEAATKSYEAYKLLVEKVLATASSSISSGSRKYLKV